MVAPYAHTLWDAAYSEGVPEALLQKILGQPAITDSDVPLETYLALLQAAHDHAGPTGPTGPTFGWRLGEHVKPTTYGVNGILLLACPTLGDALQQVLRFECLVHDLGRSDYQRHGEQVIYGWRNDCSQHPMAAILAESVFSGIQTCAHWLVDRTPQPDAIEFAHPAHPDAVDYIQQHCLAPVRWGTGHNRIIFHASVLDWPIPQANKALLPLLQQHAEALLQTRYPQEPDILTRVRQSISRRLGHEAVKLADVAQDLHLSTRTLQRRLMQTGIGFQTLLDNTRHELARHYLASSAMPIAEVGYLLGFQDTPAFHHAFKTWQGQGPGQYRSSVHGIS